ncbi:insulinase family protein [Cellvibrio fibrivorans]|uniref:Protease 3 n=1 Tax=Cellvibrio fibrivorans TaxID=126350 RepID=A0ABU1UXL1_9GAMM|nr:insulinase family protein [Cellvibrio fibrivorans]MDR7089885.1 secreted Zn-dependent insulinase-like peptidase [Cellvibrio fibrivorans]
MVKWCCRFNLNASAPWLAAVACLFASQLLSAQGSSATGGNTQENSVQRSANSIFNATIDLNTTAGVIKSENDKRNYRYLVLDNQLRVLLISDPSTEKSAAALDVNVGANQNPVDRAGLAHFLEHMLFLGTEKYPQAGEYQEFISRYGGSFNAYTAAENTNYFFEIDNDQLDPALDRFAQFFVAPLFSAEYVERERNAVNSEYLAKLKDDGRREWDVYRELMNPQHPSAKFSVGNLTTLADREGHPVREDMIAFYQQHYSSHLMNLVVLGRENLDELEAGVRARFSAVPKRDIHIADNYPPLFDKQRLPASVDIKPEKELRQLTFNFPIPNPDQFYEKKPFAYIANLLGHEAEGSLLSLLKRLGWAEAIYANTGLQSRKDAVFQLSIQLTPQGVRARNQIVSLVFHCIEQLQPRGLSPWRYSELQQLADLEFRFQEKRPPMQTVSALAESMKTYAPKDILRGDYVYTAYDERLIKKSLSYLTSDNLLLVLTAPDVEPYRVSPFYSAPFVVRAGIPELLDLKPAVRKELFLPEKNLFIPKRLAVKSGSMLEETGTADIKPQLILGNKNMRVWFAQDQQFMQPRALINLRIKSPLVAASAEGAALAQLFAALVSDQLNEFSYPARLAGIDHTITANVRGYELSIFGYSSRQGLLMNKMMEVMRTSKFNGERFALIKEDLLRTWRNQNKDLPYQVLAKQLPVLQSDPYWSNAQLIAALENKTLEQFAQFASRQLIDAKMDALFYGNYFRAEALKLAVLVEHELLNRQAGRELPAAKLLLLPKGLEKPWLYAYPVEHADNVVELLIQNPSTSIDDAAHMMLVRQLLQPEFYNQLRTEKQLGYVVAAIAAPLLNLENSLLVVQSPSVREEKIIEEIDLFLDEQQVQIGENFTINQQSLIKKLREPARSLKEQGERYWSAITTFDNHFSRRLDLADAVARITPESLDNFYRAVFMDKNRRLWLTSDVPVESENFFLVDDLLIHKQQMQSIALP